MILGLHLPFLLLSVLSPWDLRNLILECTVWELASWRSCFKGSLGVRHVIPDCKIPHLCSGCYGTRVEQLKGDFKGTHSLMLCSASVFFRVHASANTVLRSDGSEAFLLTAWGFIANSQGI